VFGENFSKAKKNCGLKTGSFSFVSYSFLTWLLLAKVKITSTTSMKKLLRRTLVVSTIFWGLSMVANISNWLFNLQAGRILPKEDFAILSVFLSFQYLLSVPATALSTTVNRFTAYYTEKNEPQKYFYFFRQYWWLTWVIGLTFFSLFLLMQNFLGSFFSLKSSWQAIAFAPIILPLFLLAFESGVLFGRLQIIWVGVLYVFGAAVKLLFFILFPKAPFSALTMAIIALPVSVLVAWLASVFIGRSFRPPWAGEWLGKKNFEETYKFLGSSVFTGLGTILIFNIDVLLVNHYLPSYEAGVYATLSLLGKVLYFGAGSLIGLLVPLTAQAQAKNEPEQRPLLMVLGVVALAGVGILAAYSLFPQLIVRLLLTEGGLVTLPYLFKYSLAMLFLVLAACFTTYNLAKKNYFQANLITLAAIFQGLLIFLFHQSVSQVVEMVLISILGLLICLVIVEITGLTGQALQNNLKSFLGLFFKEPNLSNEHKKAKIPIFNKHKKTRILIFNWRDIKHQRAGGAEIYVFELARHLVKNGFEVTLFAANDGRCDSAEIVQGVKIVRRGGFVTVYFWAALYYLFKFRKKADLVIDSENGIPFFSPLYCSRPTILLVHHVHQDVFLRSLIPPFSWLALFFEIFLMPVVYRQSTVVAVSFSTAEDLQKVIGLKTAKVIFNGVDTFAYKTGKKAASPLVCYVGRLKKYKSIEVLLEAFSRLIKQIPDARLLIAGEGDYRSFLESKAKDLGLGDTVRFLGRVLEEEKINLLVQSWVMVNPSYLEGWGITCLEANACGTPVLASRVEGLKESVSEGESGYLFNYGQADDLFWKLKWLLTDKTEREKLSRTARNWSQKYSWSEQTKKFEELICQTLNIGRQKGHLGKLKKEMEEKWLNPVFP
jgi:glycosyltransferase involved in cell wall biosynthesis/O-antigen/teichoic acid export membrane protein